MNLIGSGFVGGLSSNLNKEKLDAGDWCRMAFGVEDSVGRFIFDA